MSADIKSTLSKCYKHSISILYFHHKWLMTVHEPLFGNIGLVSTIGQSTKMSSLSQTLWYHLTMCRISESESPWCFPLVMSTVLVLLWTCLYLRLHLPPVPSACCLSWPHLCAFYSHCLQSAPLLIWHNDKDAHLPRKSFLFHQAFGGLLIS